MKNIQYVFGQICAGVLLATGFLVPQFSIAEVLDLPTVPFDGSSSAVSPNFLYVLDNSYSMNYDHTNDALGTTLPPNGTTNDRQCKVAMKDKNGHAITALSRTGTELTITLSSGDYRKNNKVYLAIPGNPQFSGTYNIDESNYTAAVGGTTTCPSGSVTSQTGTIHHDAVAYADGGNYKYNEHGAQCINCGTESQYYTQACSVTTSKPSAIVNTDTWKNRGGGTTSDCYWRENKDTAAAAAWDEPVYTTTCPGGWVTTSGTSAVSGRVLKVTVENSGTSGAFSSAEIADAYIVIKSDDKVCRYEPPQYSNQINSLYYDPTVSYVPPPWPKNITSAAPGNTLPSMNKANTSGWQNVRIDGTKLKANGDPYDAKNGTACSMTTNNRLTCNNTYRAPDGSYNFLYWREMVYCDTPNRPAAFSTDRLWHESNRCKKNTLESNAVNLSPNYPYPYPAHKDGGVTTPSKTKFYEDIILHQNGKTPLTSENPIADLYAFGEYYNYAPPHYFNVRPIEYCDSAKLKNCTFSSTPTGTYKFPSYVRYCKTATQATDTSVQPAAVAGVAQCQSQYDGTYKYARYGLFERVDVTPKVAPLNVVDKTFYKYPNRDDCSGSVGAGGCSYEEEMTNLANWFAYYRTRMQLMKSASAIAFNSLDKKYRVGFMTINQPQDAGNYLPIKEFATSADYPSPTPVPSDVSVTHKQDWLTSLYSNFPAGTTPLRGALSAAGRLFAGKKPVAALGYTGADPDPMQFSCQKNFTLLTTDGYWNDTDTSGKAIDGTTSVGNLDGDETTSPRPKFEGPTDVSGTLADVSKYYFETDIRDPLYNNCVGSVNGEVTDLCSNAKSTQKMKTLTLGLGVDGERSYVNNYATTSNANYIGSDYEKIVNGTLDWPVPVANSASAVDDLWHAAVNSDGTYFSAKSPKELKDSLNVVITDIDKALKSGAPAAVSSLEPASGDYAYSTTYVSEKWTGNVVARELSLSLGSFYKNTTPAPAVWCADVLSILDTSITSCPNTNNLSSRVAASSDTRTILMKKDTTPSSQDLVNFDLAEMSTAQANYFSPAYLNGKLTQWTSLSAEITAAGADKLVKFLRGQNGYEDRTPDNPANQRIFRTREAVLGDVTDSDPVFIGPDPMFSYLDPGYPTSFSQRTRTVYVGANDGMLHAFDALTGYERWAYVPSVLFPKLHKLAEKNYTSMHENFVNGDPVVGEICVDACGTSAASWKTILVGGLAQGGRGYYALDITDSDNPKLLWEFNYTDDSDLGYSYGKPVITKKSDGTWVVLVTSGYNNGSAGRLYVLGAKGDGFGGANLLDEIVTPSANNSGLAQVSGLAANNQLNNTSKYAYGGDLLGNLWKFNIDTGSVSLFATLEADGSAQPITVAPVLVKIGTKALVIVGTGKLLEFSDISASDQQTLYAIKDDESGTTNANPRDSTDFVEQKFTTDISAKKRTVTDNDVNLNNKKGWWIDFDENERQTVMAQVLAGALTVPTVVKSGDACSPEGFGWITQLDYASGKALDGKTSTDVGTYVDSPVTGLVNLVKKDVDGRKKLEISGFGTGTTGGGGGGGDNNNYDPVQVEPPNPLTTEGAFGGNRLIWRELIE